MNNEFNFNTALDQLLKEKNIDKEELLKAIETSIASAYKKNSKESRVDVEINRDSGEINIFETKKVVEDVTNDNLEISLEDARAISSEYDYGDIVRISTKPKDFGRIAAQNAKQLIMKQIMDAEQNLLFDEYKDKVHEVLNGNVTRIDRDNVFVNLGEVEALLPVKERIPGEVYERNKRLKVYLVDVKKGKKGNVQLKVSRTHPELITRLFEEEIPEIYSGKIDIVNVARDPGNRSKIAVVSHQPELDPVGACIGTRGSRIQNVLNELGGERVDVIEYSKDIKEYLANAINPAKIERIIVNPEKKSSIVIVNDDQLALAIGKEGKNVQLAARLTGWKVDIKSITQFEEILEENPNYEEEFIETDESYELDQKIKELLESDLLDRKFDDEPEEDDSLFDEDSLKELFDEK